MAEATMQKLNTMGEPIKRTYGGKNAITAIEHYANVNTPYLAQNQGYAKIVGVQFDNNPKVYDYIDINGTARTGDSPAVEVTNKHSGVNSTVPGRHTKIVSTGKGGIARNEQRLDKITSQGINLKVLDSKALKGQQKTSQPSMTKQKGV